MSKKHLKRLKELQRLQALHQDAAHDAPPGDAGGTETPTPKVILDQPFGGEAPATTPSAPMAVDQHAIIKRDLVFVIVLIVVMLLVLVALNWLVDNTAFSQWLIKIVGVVTN